MVKNKKQFMVKMLLNVTILLKKKGKTELIATMNTPEKYIPYIADTFPNALDFIKLIAESLINKLKINRSVSHVL